MIRHCAFFRFRKNIPEKKICRLLEEFVGLAPKLEGLLNIHVGPNISQEGLDRGFKYGIIMDFTTPAARDAYLVHPDHVALAKRLIADIDGGVAAGIIAFDLDYFPESE